MEFVVNLDNMELSRFRDLAQAAEELGYHMILFPDHVMQEARAGSPPYIGYDTMLVAATVAEATKRIRIGHLVLCNLFRHPLITARALATLDRLSHGRAVAGLGSGWMEYEFRKSGIPFPPIAQRLRMLDEALSVIRSLWCDDQTTFKGEFYQLDGATLHPKPLQLPYPPILLGGGGKGLLRLAARHADYINIMADVGKVGRFTADTQRSATDGGFSERVRFVRDEAVRQGRYPESVKISNLIFNWIVTDSRQAARQSAEQIASPLGIDAEQARRSPFNLIGTAEECIAELQRRVRNWGVSQFVFPAGFRAPADPEKYRQLYQQVLAHLG